MDEVNAAAVFWYLDGKALDWVGQTGPGRGVQVRGKITSTNSKQIAKSKLKFIVHKGYICGFRPQSCGSTHQSSKQKLF